MNPLQWLVIGLIRGYQRIVSPVLTALLGPLGMGCRFQPTCSQYALEAVRDHGIFRGVWLACRRLSRCHPWGDAGFDPVPPRKSGSDSRRCPGHHRISTETAGNSGNA